MYYCHYCHKTNLTMRELVADCPTREQCEGDGRVEILGGRITPRPYRDKDDDKFVAAMQGSIPGL